MARPAFCDGNQPRGRANQRHNRGVDKAIIIYGMLWMIFVVTQFRMPWTPLTYSEEAPTGGIRQIFSDRSLVSERAAAKLSAWRNSYFRSC